MSSNIAYRRPNGNSCLIPASRGSIGAHRARQQRHCCPDLLRLVDSSRVPSRTSRLCCNWRNGGAARSGLLACAFFFGRRIKHARDHDFPLGATAGDARRVWSDAHWREAQPGHGSRARGSAELLGIMVLGLPAGSACAGGRRPAVCPIGRPLRRRGRRGQLREREGLHAAAWAELSEPERPGRPYRNRVQPDNSHLRLPQHARDFPGRSDRWSRDRRRIRPRPAAPDQRSPKGIEPS